MLKAQLVPKAIVWGNTQGPKVAPGSYVVRLKKGETVLTGKLAVKPHPGLKISEADLAAQAAFLRESATGSPTCTRRCSGSAT